MFGGYSQSGVDGGGDGLVTLLAGAGAILVGCVGWRSGVRASWGAIAYALGMLGASVVAYDWTGIMQRVENATTGDDAILATVGAGFYLTGLASLVVALAGLGCLATRR